MMFNKKSSFIFDSLSKSLPDDRPITSLQIVENIDKCPQGFFPINKTYDQDQDADLWREGSSFLKKKSIRYLCLSKTEGLPDFVVQQLVILNEKSLPPEGFSLLNRTADSEQKAWRKKQLCYRLVNRRHIEQAVTDIIICSRLKKAPEGFTLAGELNGVIVCYKMGNVQDAQSHPDEPNGNGVRPPERPPKPMGMGGPGGVYPNLGDGGDHDYEILNPGFIPSRPAPRPPPPQLTHQTSIHNTLSSGHSGLEGVPFVLNSRLANNGDSNKLHLPTIKLRTMSQLMKDYDYDFRLERET